MSCAVFALLVASSTVAAPPEFDKSVAPLLVKRCATCHSGDDPKGDLDITRKAAVTPADVWKRVAADEMPPKKPLTADEKATLKAWIDGGATWGTDPIRLRPDPADWWSFQPLRVNPAREGGGAIDHFVNAELKARGLTPAPLADRRTLIRRLYFDLTGLPPTPEKIDAFVKDDRPDAYEKLVDELLASPRYGERWARHWLDVVHYGETHGYDKDQPRPNAWPYRDYVIRAFNSDKPYTRFVQEQVAGDVLFPGTEDGITALGFLSAGPWDFIGHVELPESKIDGKVARHLDRDDFVSNTVGTFLSLTAHCAQCHDHKFDPISQKEYYGLQAVFAAIDRADRTYDTDPTVTAKRAELTAKRTTLETRLTKLDAAARAKGGKPLADAEAKLAAARKPPAVKPEYGYHSAIAKTANETKWVQVDLGKAVSLDKVLLHPCWDDFNGIGAGFGFPVRYKVEVADDAEFKKAVTLVDHTTDQPTPGVAAVEVPAKGHSARYVRVTATKLAPRQNDYIFALAELVVIDTDGKNAAVGAAVTALDSIEAPVRWRKSNLTDGMYPRTAATADEVKRMADHVQKLLADALGAEGAAERAKVQAEVATTTAELTKLPKQAGRVYAGGVHTGGGNFIGTGASGGKPRPIHVLSRGDVTKPGKAVGPGALAAIPVKFEVSPTAPEGERRAALAKWLTDNENPLLGRSIVNRVWQYHFGRGLVDTPNDFGRMGEKPTHPELLDWLAVEFRDGGGSFKKLHKLIVTSDAYKRASTPNAVNEKADADNRYLWRQNRRKLEAEAVRDSILFAAGKLDLAMGGPSFQDFVIEKPEHSPHYQYHLSDPDDVKTHRRAVYRFVVRSKQQPFLAALDCADPSLAVDKRNQTITPQQALALLNNKLTLAMAKHFAERVEKLAADDVGRMKEAFKLAIGREPTAKEAELLAKHAKEHGLASACRAILNLNEFAFVD